MSDTTHSQAGGDFHDEEPAAGTREERLRERPAPGPVWQTPSQAEDERDDPAERTGQPERAEQPESESERTEDASGDDGRPGAGSGAEQRARERVVPGTASAAEGYSSGGTASGNPLTGVEAEDGPQDGAGPADGPD